MACAIYVYYINIGSDSSGSHPDSHLCEPENLLAHSGLWPVMAPEKYENEILANPSVKGKNGFKIKKHFCFSSTAAHFHVSF